MYIIYIVYIIYSVYITPKCVYITSKCTLHLNVHVHAGVFIYDAVHLSVYVGGREGEKDLLGCSGVCLLLE